jgi:hypothetical protein
MALVLIDREYCDVNTYMNPSIGYRMVLIIDKSSNEPVLKLTGFERPNRGMVF